MTYTQLKWSIIGLLLLYAAVGFLADATKPENDFEDVYPFFSWFLFIHVPKATQRGFDARLTSIEGVALTSSVSLTASPVAPKNDVRPIQMHNFIDALGRALKSGDKSAIEAARKALESRFQKKATYEVLEIRYHPVDRWRTGALLEETVIGTFAVI
jgi:hypothetical protein